MTGRPPCPAQAEQTGADVDEPESTATRTGRNRRHWRHRFFQLAVILKGIDGVLETAGGVLLLSFGKQGVSRLVRLLTQHELSEDPHDFVANLLIRAVHHIGASTVHFAAAYLLVHGVIKIALVGGLIREKRWVFPIALVFLGLFVLYQIYRLQHQPSYGLASLTVLDLIIIGLVWWEWEELPKNA
ncbi:MAG: DUF2127 domain-containing protein [Gemmatimonadota bacterium]|jgi:uncharacterized membrane protein